MPQQAHGSRRENSHALLAKEEQGLATKPGSLACSKRVDCLAPSADIQNVDPLPREAPFVHVGRVYVLALGLRAPHSQLLEFGANNTDLGP